MRTYESINSKLLLLFGPLVPPATPLEHKIAVTQQNLIVRTAPLSAIITAANALLIAITMWPYIPSPILLVWIVFMLSFSALSVSLWYRFANRPLPNKASGEFLLKTEAMAAAMGAAWGALKFGLVTSSVEANLFFMLVAAGTAAGFCAIASQMPRVAVRFSSFALLPILIATVMESDEFGPAIIVLGLALYISLAKGSLYSFAQLRELVTSSIDAREAQRDLLNAVESISDAFAIYDENGKPQLTNSSFRKWFDEGWAAQLGDDGVEQRIAGNRWVIHSVSERPVGGWVSVHRDITGLKERERDLHVARREAEEASVAKGRFLSTMSHELRTPLNIINGFSKLMTRRSNVPLDETTVREYGDCIHEAGEHLLKVINDIIEFSEAGSGATSYDPVPVDPKSLLASAVSLAVGFNRTGSLDGIRVSVSPALGELIVDEMAIRRVLISLVSNAIRFGGSPLVVTIRAHVRDDGCPVISVSDNGGGLSPDEIEQVFRPFFQCDRHRGGDFAGTGLGLTISRQLAHLHGGDIVMRSRPGKGTTAALILPAATHLQAGSKQPASRQAA